MYPQEIKAEQRKHGLPYTLLDHERKGAVPVLPPSSVQKFISEMSKALEDKKIVAYTTEHERNMLQKAGLLCVNLYMIEKDCPGTQELKWLLSPVYNCPSHACECPKAIKCASYKAEAFKKFISIAPTAWI